MLVLWDPVGVPVVDILFSVVGPESLPDGF